MVSPVKSYIMKISVCGDGSVGKTSMVLQYCEKKFQENYIMTIGSNFAIKSLKLDNANVRLQIWDLAGQQHFSFVRPPFYRGASAAIYVFDITRRESFEHLDEWKEEVDTVLADKPFVIVGNKIDLSDERVVSKKEAEDYAANVGALGYFETSAKSGINLDTLFEAIVKNIINNIRK